MLCVMFCHLESISIAFHSYSLFRTKLAHSCEMSLCMYVLCTDLVPYIKQRKRLQVIVEDDHFWFVVNEPG